MQPSRKVSRIAISAVFFCYGLCFASWASRIPSIQEKLRLTEAALGGVLFALPVGSVVSLPLSGYLVAKYGSRNVVILSSLVYVCLLSLIGFAPTVTWLITVLFLFGLLGNMLNISINTQAVAAEAVYKKNIMATFHGMWSLGGFMGAGIGAVMIAASQIPLVHYLIVSGTVVLLLLICFRFLITTDVNTDINKPLFSLPDRSLFVLGLIAFCSMLCEGAMFDWSGVYFKNVVKVKEDFIGMGYTGFMIAMAGSRFIADKMVHLFGIKPVLKISGLLICLGLMLSVVFSTFVPALAGFFIVGIGVSSVVPLVYSLAGKSQVQSPGVALASVSTLGFFGFLIGPPLIGMIAGATDLKISFALLVLVGLGIVYLSGKNKG